jgi:hypothetical protein
VAVAGCLALLFGGSLLWAKGRDPFQRVWFAIKAPGVGKAECNPGRTPTPLCVRVPLRSTQVAECIADARRQTVTKKRLLRERNRKHTWILRRFAFLS